MPRAVPCAIVLSCCRAIVPPYRVRRDFGSAAFLSDGDDLLSSTVGTPAFFAPEVWQHHTHGHGHGDAQGGRGVTGVIVERPPGTWEDLPHTISGVNGGMHSAVDGGRRDGGTDGSAGAADGGHGGGGGGDDGGGVEACYLGGFAGKPADVWAAGVTMFMMVTGRHPFWRAGGQSTQELEQAVMRNACVCVCVCGAPPSRTSALPPCVLP